MHEVPRHDGPQPLPSGPGEVLPDGCSPATSGSESPRPPATEASAAPIVRPLSARSTAPGSAADPSASRPAPQPAASVAPSLPPRIPPTSLARDAARKRAASRGGSKLFRWGIATALVIGLLFIAGGIYLMTSLRSSGVGRIGSRASLHHGDLREVLLETASTRDKIAIVDVQGVISSDPWDYQGNNLVSYIEEQLERAAEDDHVRAVLLKIDSPGGEVLASDEIYKLVAEFQENHDKPVVASMGTIAASGGYYVAAPCRWIVANELTITGSIGVIMQSYNWRGLMDKVGVRPQVFKSGAFKDMLSPDKPESDITSEERRIVQNLVNETFDRFQSVIEEGRGLASARNEDNAGESSDQGRKLSESWKEFADGRLLSGKEAWKLGFVDELGDFSAAVDRALKLAGIEEARLIQYLRPPSFGSLFRLLGANENARVQVDLGIPVPKLRAGLYFLAPQLVR